MNEIEGEKIIEKCKEHVLATMRMLPECSPDGPGWRNKDIETAAGFALGLPRQDGWLTWSLLMALVREKRIQFSTRGKRGIRYFRLR